MEISFNQFAAKYPENAEIEKTGFQYKRAIETLNHWAPFIACEIWVKCYEDEPSRLNYCYVRAVNNVEFNGITCAVELRGPDYHKKFDVYLRVLERPTPRSIYRSYTPPNREPIQNMFKLTSKKIEAHIEKEKKFVIADEAAYKKMVDAYEVKKAEVLEMGGTWNDKDGFGRVEKNGMTLHVQHTSDVYFDEKIYWPYASNIIMFKHYSQLPAPKSI